VQTQPTGDTCSVTNGSGTIATSNVTNVGINCAANTLKIGGAINGLSAGGYQVLGACRHSTLLLQCVSDRLSKCNIFVDDRDRVPVLRERQTNLIDDLALSMIGLLDR
jgi:hypothetical protein